MYDSIISFKNLLRAYKETRRHKRYKKTPQRYEFSYEERILSLQAKLKDKTYVPSPYHKFITFEPKKRQISAPIFKDRIVHHAIMNFIGPVFNKFFIKNSFACQKGKGPHLGVKTIQSVYQNFWLENPKFYALKCDIKSYFASIDHQILFSFLRKQIHCPDILSLLKIIINSYEDSPGKGIPIGNLTSQLFANIYLHPLDIFVSQNLKEPNYFRYMDDFLILSHNKKYLKEMRIKIKDFLEENLKLQLHPKKANIFRADFGLDFLGYTIYPDKTTLRKRTVRRYKRRHKKRLKKLKQLREELAKDNKDCQLSLFKTNNLAKESEEIEEQKEKIEDLEKKIFASTNSFKGFLKYSKYSKLKGGGVLVSTMKIPNIFKQP